MKVTYKVVDYRPEVEWIAIEFTHSDRPDEPWTEQFAFPDFTREKLIDHIRAVASRVAGSWTRISDHPAELSIPETGVVDVEPELYLPYEPNPQYEPEPTIDEWTQDLLPGEVTSPTQETIPWVVYDLTPEEVQSRLDGAAEAARNERNWYLLQSDHIFCTDVQVEDRDAWLEYRQALRDLPTQSNFPKEIDWPRRPGE